MSETAKMDEVTIQSKVEKLKFDEETLEIKLKVCARHKDCKSVIRIKKESEKQLSITRNLIQILERELHDKEIENHDKEIENHDKEIRNGVMITPMTTTNLVIDRINGMTVKSNTCKCNIKEDISVITASNSYAHDTIEVDTFKVINELEIMKIDSRDHHLVESCLQESEIQGLKSMTFYNRKRADPLEGVGRVKKT